MPSITYNFPIDSSVLAYVGDDLKECTVLRISLEVDPDENGTPVDEIVYHLYIEGTMCDVILREEDEIFSHNIPTPETINYQYSLGDTVWSFFKSRIFECNVIQISIDVESVGNSITYNLLPNNVGYNSLDVGEDEVFNTESEVRTYLDIP